MRFSYEHSDDSPAAIQSGRRSRRIETELWVRLGGVEASMRRREGDLCATGVYIATTEPVGSPGDVLLLQAATIDRSVSIQTLARVARVIRQDDRVRGARIIGAAFEFLPLDKVQTDILQLVSHASKLELVKYGSLRLDNAVRAYADTESGDSFCAELRSIGVQTLTLSCHFPVALGQQVDVEIPHDGGVTQIRGEVLNVAREAQRSPEQFSVLLRLDATAITQEHDALHELVVKLLTPEGLNARLGAHHDFGGQLEQLQIDQVLRLLEREGYSGVLSAGNHERFLSFEVSNGRLLKCDSPTALDCGDALEQLRLLSEGEFKFKNRRPADLSTLSVPTARLIRDVLKAQDPT